MNYPKDYFYDEIREGFYINGMVKREWAAQMETLGEIDRVCRKHGIKWFADCGTLIGAVRHGGYVPWDDDLDICMLRDDYRRFHKLAVPELPAEYVVLTHETGEYWQMITRVTNREKISYREEDLEKYHQFPYAAGVDIFVLDYVSPDPEEEEVRRQLVKTVLQVASYDGMESDNPPEAGLKMIPMLEAACHTKIDRKKPLRPQLFSLAETLSCLYPSEGAREVVLMPYWCSDHNHKYPIEYVDRIVQLPFEHIMINVPAGYDGALKIEYGDYLKICRNGGIHDYPLYEMQEDFLMEKLETGNPFRYEFSEEDLVCRREDRPERLRGAVLKFCSMLREIHSVIRATGENGTADLREILMQSQENVISLGTRIESESGEGTATVKQMEGYCELLYNAAVFSMEDVDNGAWHELMKKMDRSLSAIEETAAEELKDYREILFLPFRSDLWDTMKPFYDKAIENPMNRVHVMPLPFYDRRADGGLGKLNYETDSYPDGLPLTDYRSYDIPRRHPDAIYIQNPYDQCSYVYMLPPEYFTSELKRHTEQLVYIPYFRIGEYSRDDMKLIKTTDYFVKVPGLIHSDRVIVESDAMKELYCDMLTEFCGEETRGLWDDKITVFVEPPKTGLDEKDIPDEWRSALCKPNGVRKKAVLFVNAVCSMYQYKEKAIQKLKQSLQVFYDNRDSVALIWRPQPAIRRSAKVFDRSLWLEYRSIVDGYLAGGWGVLDETDDERTAVRLADAYYGDPDPVMQRCRTMGKPVMIWNTDIY